MPKYKEERVKYPKKGKDLPLKEKPNKHVQDLYLAASKNLKREQDYYARAEKHHREWQERSMKHIQEYAAKAQELLA